MIGLNGGELDRVRSSMEASLPAVEEKYPKGLGDVFNFSWKERLRGDLFKTWGGKVWPRVLMNAVTLHQVKPLAINCSAPPCDGSPLKKQKSIISA